MNSRAPRSGKSTGPWDAILEGLRLLRNHPWYVFILCLLIVVVFAITSVTASGKSTEVILAAIAALVVLFIIAVLAGHLDRRSRITNFQSALPAVPAERDTIRLAESLDAAAVARIKVVLEAAANDVAAQLAVDPSTVRANVFGVRGARCFIIPRLTYNMHDPVELTMEMGVGEGSSGICFATGAVSVARFEQDWGRYTLHDAELRKANPELRWILSIPVVSSLRSDDPLWVLNVDGLRTTPSSESLERAARSLFYWAHELYSGAAPSIRAAAQTGGTT